MPPTKSARAVSRSALNALFCARNGGSAASTNRRPHLEPSAHAPLGMHHNSLLARMARNIVPVRGSAACDLRSGKVRLRAFQKRSPRRRQYRSREKGESRPAPAMRVRYRPIGTAGLDRNAQRPRFWRARRIPNREAATHDDSRTAPEGAPSRGDRRCGLRRAGMRASAQGRAGLDHAGRPPQPSSVSAAVVSGRDRVAGDLRDRLADPLSPARPAGGHDLVRHRERRRRHKQARAAR